MKKANFVDTEIARGYIGFLKDQCYNYLEKTGQRVNRRDFEMHFPKINDGVAAAEGKKYLNQMQNAWGISLGQIQGFLAVPLSLLVENLLNIAAGMDQDRLDYALQANWGNLSRRFNKPISLRPISITLEPTLIRDLCNQFFLNQRKTAKRRRVAMPHPHQNCPYCGQKINDLLVELLPDPVYRQKETMNLVREQPARYSVACPYCNQSLNFDQEGHLIRTPQNPPVRHDRKKILERRNRFVQENETGPVSIPAWLGRAFGMENAFSDLRLARLAKRVAEAGIFDQDNPFEMEAFNFVPEDPIDDLRFPPQWYDDQSLLEEEAEGDFSSLPERKPAYSLPKDELPF